MSFKDNLANFAVGLVNGGYSEKEISSYKLCLIFSLLCEDGDLFLGKPFSSLVLNNKAESLLLSARLYEFFCSLPYGLRDFAVNLTVPTAAVPYLVRIIEDEDRPTTADLGAVFLSDGQERKGTAYTERQDIDRILDNLLDGVNAHDAAQAHYLDAACGCGAFLIRTVQRLAELCEEQPDAQSSWIDQDNICGIELDPQAALISRAAVWIESRKAQLGIAKNTNKLPMLHVELPERIVCADAIKSDWLAFDPDYIIGNPPFMTPNEEQRPVMQSLVGTFRVDYAAAWIVKAADCIRAKQSIRCSYLITNSVCQGAQVTPIWQPLSEFIDLDFAYEPFQFGQTVQVWCVIIGFSAKITRPKKLYATRASAPTYCEHINYHLHADEDMFLTQSKEQVSGYPVMRQFQDPATAQLTRYPTENSVLYVTADSMIKGAYSYILAPEEQEQPPTNYIVVPRHSSETRANIPVGWYENTRIKCNSSVCVIEGADLFLLGILMSNVHNAFAKYFCGRLEMRYRYSHGLIYNNLPIPQPTEIERERIITSARGIIQGKSRATSISYSNRNVDRARRHLNVLVDKLYNNGKLFSSDKERVRAVYQLLCHRDTKKA